MDPSSETKADDAQLAEAPPSTVSPPTGQTEPSSETKADDAQPTEAPPSTTDLFSSAKLVAEAAQASFQGGADTIDKGRVAGAAADLLGAASDYGKLEEKGYGQYVEKAETYLHQYGSTGSAAAPAGEAAAAPAQGDGEAPSGVGEGLFKAAGGFLKGF